MGDKDKLKTGIWPTVKPFVNGGASGMLATCVIQPIDMIKVRIQLGQGSAGQVARTMIKEEGFGSLYKGLSAGLLRQATYTTARLGSFRILTNKAIEANDGKPLPLYQKALCGLTAGAIGASVGSPADLALIRMQVMGRLLKLPQHPQLLQTVCLTIRAYSKWLDAASGGLSILPSVIDVLMSGLAQSEDSATAAALAFRQICDDCRLKLCGCLEGLFHIYHMAVNGEGTLKVCAEDSLLLVEALSKVISELPPDQAKRALEALCLPVVSPLQEVLSQAPEMLNNRSARDFTVHIDRFGYIFRYVTHAEAVADAVQRLWPIFKVIVLYSSQKWVYAMISIGVLGFLVWAHHIFSS